MEFHRLHLYLQRSSLICALVLVSLLAGCIQSTEPPPAKTSTGEESTHVRVLVLPHHDLILSKFDSFYASIPISERPEIKTVYLLSPNHFHPEINKIVTKGEHEQLKNIGVQQQDEWFFKEHGTFLHLPFIQKYLPNAKVTPLLFTRHIPKEQLEALSSFLLAESEKESVLFIVSADFSHNLSATEASDRDQETLSLLQHEDEEALLKLADTHVDCSACLYLATKVTKGVKPMVLFHGNSSEFMQISPDAITTSYFVLEWRVPSRQNRESTIE